MNRNREKCVSSWLTAYSMVAFVFVCWAPNQKVDRRRKPHRDGTNIQEGSKPKAGDENSNGDGDEDLCLRDFVGG